MSLQITLNSGGGPLEMEPHVFAIMEGRDDTSILERVTAGKFGISPNAELKPIARDQLWESYAPY